MATKQRLDGGHKWIELLLVVTLLSIVATIVAGEAGFLV